MSFGFVSNDNMLKFGKQACKHYETDRYNINVMIKCEDKCDKCEDINRQM